MKSRTSSFNWTILRKDITRFAPAWILYGVGLALLMTQTYRAGNHDQTAANFASTAYTLAIINCIYGLLTAQLLFGDLFSPRMANALHALPLRRESWFATHVTAGPLFSLVPNLVMTLMMTAFCGSVPDLPWLWLLTAMGYYLFFFGLAVFCAMCVGSRFAMVVVYGLVNFGSLLAYWMVNTLYIPLMYGITLDLDPFLRLSPVCYGTEHIPMTVEYGKIVTTMTLNQENLNYLLLVGLAGLAFGALALVLYRRRQLEAAGDFIAVTWLKPVFLVVYTVMMGACFESVMRLFSNAEYHRCVGWIVGFFTGKMLLNRTTRIFTKDTWIQLGAFCLAGAVSFGLVVWDPLGIVTWVPEAEDVESVSLETGGFQGTEVFTDPEDIALMVELHQLALDTRDEDSPIRELRYYNLVYTMKDGSTHTRDYYIPAQGTVQGRLVDLFNEPEIVVGDLYEIWRTERHSITVTDPYGNEVHLTLQQWEDMMAAIELDCAAGTMGQDDALHSDYACSYPFALSFRWYDDDNARHSCNIQFYLDAENSRAWVEQQSFYDDYWEEWNRWLN